MRVDILPEPDGIGFRTCAHVGDEVGVGNPLPLADLGRIWLDRSVMAAAEHMYELVLDQAAGNGRVVLEYEQRFDRTGEAHLLREAPAGGIRGAFVRQWMAA